MRRGLNIRTFTFLLLGWFVLAPFTVHSQQVIIDFDTFPDGSPVPEPTFLTDQYAEAGVIFDFADTLFPPDKLVIEDASDAVFAGKPLVGISLPNILGAHGYDEGPSMTIAANYDLKIIFVDPTTHVSTNVSNVSILVFALASNPPSTIYLQAKDSTGIIIDQDTFTIFDLNSVNSFTLQMSTATPRIASVETHGITGNDIAAIYDNLVFSNESNGNSLTVSTSNDIVWANGHEETEIIVEVKDQSNVGIEGRFVRLSSDRPDEVIIKPSKVIIHPDGIENNVVVTDNLGEARFEVSSSHLGSSVLTAVDVNDNSLWNSITVDFVQRRVIIFVQGINTELNPLIETEIFPNIRSRITELGFIRPVRRDAEAGDECANFIDDDSDGAINDGCPLIINYSYKGGKTENGEWKPKEYKCNDTKNNISLSIKRLRDLIVGYSDSNPNTRFIIIGHSQGGLIGLHTLGLSQRPNVTIDAFISLDGALGGAPPFSSTISRLSCWGKPASKDMSRLWDSASDHDRQGSTASFLGQTNEEVASLAQDNNVIVVTIGSFDDCVWNHNRCGIPAINNESTQIIDNADLVSMFTLGENCSVLDQGPTCLYGSHNIVHMSLQVLDIVQTVIRTPFVE